MATIALSQNVSLDGVMQSPGPTDVPFEHRGWAVDFAEEGFDYEAEVGLPEARRCSALLLGRITYAVLGTGDRLFGRSVVSVGAPFDPAAPRLGGDGTGAGHEPLIRPSSATRGSGVR